MLSKGLNGHPISMGGLRFASPPVKAEPKRKAARKKVAPSDAVTVPMAEEAVPQLEIAVQEPGDQARAA